MSHSPRAPGEEHSFRTVYEATYADLVRFVQRRSHHDHAEDIVSEAFLVVWRRFDEAPSQLDDVRAWVFGITRHLLLNDRRSDQRRRALGVRLTLTTTAVVEDGSLGVVDRVDLGRAWRLLSDTHQEVLALAVFEELRAPQAALVLAISPVAFRLRLSRARRALRLHLDHLPSRDDTAPAERTPAPDRTYLPDRIERTSTS